MNRTILPITIYKNILQNNISLDAATDILISVLEKCDNIQQRRECIEVMGKLGLKTIKLFKVLENTLLSDENPSVRASTVKHISELFPKRSLVPLNWVIHNDRSVVVLGAIYTLLKNKRSLEYDSLKKQMMIQLQYLYKVKKEVSLFLNLDIIYSEFSYNINFKAGQQWHRVMNLVKSYEDPIGLIPRLYYLKAGGTLLNLLPHSINNLDFFRSLFIKNKASKISPKIKNESIKIH
ncbi:MAG: HEAT repeat domain-containing protein [Promethearchaeota archaeon]|nr:MAG: HEAT repeat domain-containing protein [Candidatus Lokiarchaeota archaeon]